MILTGMLINLVVVSVVACFVIAIIDQLRRPHD